MKKGFLTKLYMSFKHKLFMLWQMFSYIKFALSGKNVDYDWSSIININILKLTMMGLQFAKYGVLENREKKNIVRTIWAARKQLCRCLASFDIAWNYHIRLFKSTFGDELPENVEDYILNLSLSNNTEQLSVQEEKHRAYWYSLPTWEREQEIRCASLSRALQIIEKNIFTWWD